MNINRSNIAPLNDVITITIEAADYLENFEKKLKEYQRTAAIPGFRPGKVPASVIKKRVGKDLKAEMVSNAMGNALDSYFKDNNISYFGQPIPYKPEDYKYDWENQEEFTFAYEVGLTPNVEVDIKSLPQFKYYVINVGEAEVDEYVNNLVERLTKEEKVEDTTNETDVVFGNITEVDADGNDKEGAVSGVETFYMTDTTDFVRQSLLGKQAGDSVMFNMDDAFADRTKLADTFKVDEMAAGLLTGPFKFTIVEVRRATKPEVNQEFFDRVLGPGRVTDEAGLRAELKSLMEREYEQESDYKFDYDVRNYLRSNIDVALPEEFLVRWLPTVAEKPMTDEEQVKELENLKRYLRWTVVESRIMQNNNLLVTADDLQAEAIVAMKAMFKMYGIERDDDDFYAEQAKRMLESDEQRQRYIDQAKNRKLMNFFKTELNVDNVAISKEDFKALIEQETKEAEVMSL